MAETKTSNGNGGAYGFLRFLGEKYGFPAIAFVFACGALYLCVIIPFQNQQNEWVKSSEMFRETITENAKKQVGINEKLADTIEKLALVQAGQSQILQRMEVSDLQREQLLKSVDAHMAAANEMMNPVPALREQELSATREIAEHLKEFTAGVATCHDDQNRKLDTIVEQTQPDGG